MSSHIAEITRINRLRNDITHRLSFILNRKNRRNEKSNEALNILNEIEDPEVINFAITTIANQIFLKDKSQINKELYKDYLKKIKLDWSYFEIPRLLNNDQYEQAVLLAIEEFDKLSKFEYLDKDRTASNLNFFKILKEASERNDTIIVNQILDRVDPETINDSNYSHLLAFALTKQNENILVRIYDNIVENNIELTDNTWECYSRVFIKLKDTKKILQIISIVNSIDIKTKICLHWISTFEFKECMLLLNTLIEEKILEKVNFKTLPTPLISIPDLDVYTNITEKIDIIDELSIDFNKQILIYCLLSSIDNLNVHLGSTIFLINGLKQHLGLLNEFHKDIVFHQISKYSHKLTSLKFLKLFKSLNLSISIKNYLNLVKCHCNGEEIDTLYYVLIEIIKDFDEIPTEIVEFLVGINNKINDNRLNFFINNKVSMSSLEDIKEKINFDYIENNLESEQQRNKKEIEIIHGFIPYNYENDIKLVDLLVL